MNQIIKDSYYLIGLHQERFKKINGIRLTDMLYLIEAYYMTLYDAEYLYEEEFKVDMLGMYIKEINEKFKKTENIIINDEEIKIGKDISEDRKKIIFKIYDLFGKLSDFKLHEEIFSNDSPLQFIYAIPDVLAVYIRFNISVPKSQTKKWFEENYL